MSDLNLTLRLRADNKGMVSVLDASGQKVGEFGGKAEQAGAQADRGMRQARSGSEVLGTSLTRLAGIAAATWAAFGGVRTVTRQLSDLARQASQVDDLATRLDLSTQAVQELSFAAPQLSTNIDQLGGAMFRLGRRIANAGTESGPAVRAMRELGIEAQAIAHLPLDEQMYVVIDALNDLESVTLANQFAFEIFGDEARALMPFIRSGTDEISRLRAEMRDTGAVMSAELIDRLNTLTDRMQVLRVRASGLRIALMEGIIDPLESVIDWLSRADGAAAMIDRTLGLLRSTVHALALAVAGRLVGAIWAWVAANAALVTSINAVGVAQLRLNAALLVAAVQMRTVAVAAGVARTALAAVGGPIGIGVVGLGLLGQRILEAIGHFRSFEDRMTRYRAELDSTTQAVERFSSAHLQMLAGGRALPDTLGELGEAIQKTETDLRRFTRRFGEDSVAARSAQIELDRLREAYEALGGTLRTEAASAEITDPLAQMQADLERQLYVLDHIANGYATAELALLGWQEQQALAAAAAEDEANQTTRNTEAVEAYFDRLRQLTGQIEARTAAQAAAAAAEQAAQARTDALRTSYQQLFAAINPLAAQHAALTAQLVDMQALASLSTAELDELGISAATLAEIIAHLQQQMAGLGGEGGGGFSFSQMFGLDSGQDVLDLMGDIRREMDEIAGIEFQFESMLDSFHPLAGQMRRLGADIAVIDQQLNKELISSAQAGWAKVGVSASAAFGAIMEGMDRSSSEYQVMQVAQMALNTSLGIAAILQQGQGDPYSAWARMLAMAAMVASLGVQVGSLGSGGSGGAQAAQERQGTGTVLGDADAKSESILNATELTADATRQLVGINRAQLRALTALTDAIAGATGMLARGALDMDTSNIGLGTSSWGFTRTTLRDQGISLFGGLINDLIDGVVGQAFSTTRRSNLFSTSYRNHYEALDEGLNSQINMIFASMIDAVTAAAGLIGIPLDEIERRIARYEVAAQEISLMDLSAEEQQAELMAVFSAIFDGLADAVVPFAAQYQQLGEGHGETLVRIATSIQVTEEAAHRFGWALDELSPEQMAEVSVGMMDMAGGIEGFIAGMDNFIGLFAPAAWQFDLALSDITRGLEHVNLSLPETRDGFWALMQSLDASTESGRAQIAALLELADAADTYYSALESIQSEREGLERQLLQLQGDTAALRALELETLDESNRALQQRIWALEDEIALADLLSDVGREIERMTMAPLAAEYRALRREQAAAITTARELGASTAELGEIQRLHGLQLEALAGRLREAIASIGEQLFGASSSAQNAFGADFTAPIISAADTVRDSLIRALEGVDEWLRRSSFEDPSLTGPQRLDAMMTEFDRLVDVALTGSGQAQADAVAQLPQMADALSALGTQMLGSATPEFQALWANIVSQMEQVAGIDVPDAPEPVTGQQVSAIGATLEQMEQTSLQQAELAAQMIEMIGALADITGQSPIELLEEMGYPLRDLVEMLIGEIDVMSVGLVDQLIAVANALGVDLATLATAIDVSLGELHDADSVLSQALRNKVGELPDGIHGELGPLLQALWEGEDAEAALAALKAAVEGMAPDIQELLAPFLPGLDPDTTENYQIGLWEAIRDIERAQLRALERLEQLLGDLPPHQVPAPPEPPGYSTGGWVTSNQIIRAGEQGRELILPNPVSEFFAREGIPVQAHGGISDERIVAAVERVVERMAAAELQREEIGRQQVAATRDIGHSIEDADRSRRSDTAVIR